MFTPLRLGSTFAFVLLVVACANEEDLGTRDGSPDGATDKDAPVDPSKVLGDTTTDERRRICDRDAALVGGYGKKAECKLRDGVVQSVKGPGADQAMCVGVFDVLAKCKATVGEFEECRLALVSRVCSEDPAAPPECTAIREKCPDLDLG